MSASQAKEARRAVRRAVGVEALSALDQTAADLRNFDRETRARIGRVMLLLGRDTDEDVKRPVLQRLDDNDKLRALLFQKIDDANTEIAALKQAQAERGRSFWTRLRWLLSGT
jgi:hypothetical protein